MPPLPPRPLPAPRFRVRLSRHALPRCPATLCHPLPLALLRSCCHTRASSESAATSLRRRVRIGPMISHRLASVRTSRVREIDRFLPRRLPLPCPSRKRASAASDAARMLSLRPGCTHNLPTISCSVPSRSTSRQMPPPSPNSEASKIPTSPVLGMAAPLSPRVSSTSVLCENSAWSERGCRSHGTLKVPCAAAMLAAFIASARSVALDTSRRPGSGSELHLQLPHFSMAFLVPEPPRCQMRYPASLVSIRDAGYLGMISHCRWRSATPGVYSARMAAGGSARSVALAPAITCGS
mmetsp:Transcript_57708/g.138562  ORF Transcript_57708/g.138562 Transcript_57708/m.138562 type:complete len:295 (-) Transcript_57708:60-944(-)